MIKYRTRWGKIEAVEILRETEKQVVLMRDGGRERREAKTSDWSNYFDSWDDARQFLMDAAQIKVENLRLGLQKANGELGNIKGMKNPDETGQAGH